jgi:hypothetical protein
MRKVLEVLRRPAVQKALWALVFSVVETLVGGASEGTKPRSSRRTRGTDPPGRR